jgi:MoaA/NifB/PqqE/SkfB family radical SAM enzyme
MNFINPSAKVARQFTRLSAWQRGETFAPVGVEIDLTNRCNLGCKFCHFAYTHTRGILARQDSTYEDMGDEMSIELLWRVLGEMKDSGVESITFSGGGEPTLYPHFKDAIYRAKAYDFPIGLYTNATLIDDEKAQAIKENCTWVVVSLDEPYHDAYREIKQSDKFNQACEGVTRLVKASGNAIVGVSFLVGSHHTQPDLRRMAELGIKLNADYAEYRPRILFEETNPSVANENTEWVGTALEHLGYIATVFPRVDVRSEQFKLYANYRRDYPVCHGILFTGIITPNGKMWRCVNRRGFSDSCIGDLNKRSFAEVWANQRSFVVDAKCRVLCRADVMNRKLSELDKHLPHESFL